MNKPTPEQMKRRVASPFDAVYEPDKEWKHSIYNGADAEPEQCFKNGYELGFGAAEALANTLIAQALADEREKALEDYLLRQRDWSRKTFGEGKRTVGVTEHIKKECQEVVDDPADIREWIDIVILALDGFWRAGGEPSDVLKLMQEKQDINFQRVYPKPLSENHVSEHDRSLEALKGGS